MLINKIKNRVYNLLDTNSGSLASKIYNILILFIVMFSILPLMWATGAGSPFIEWLRSYGYIFISFFMIDYVLRWWTAELSLGLGRKSYVKYPFTMWAMLDMLAILPAFISFFVPGMSGLAAFSALRALRVLTLLKGTRLGVGAMFLVNGFKNERKELAIVATMATFLVFIFALMIFQIEQEANPDISTFGDALWFAFITVTTIGYGDIIVVSATARVVVVLLSVLGIALIGVTTGLIIAGFNKELKRKDYYRELSENRTSFRLDKNFKKKKK